MLESRSLSVSQALVGKIKQAMPLQEIKIMHVCGTHETTIVRWGLRRILPPSIRVICGPGCPVCVTSAKEIDLAVELALSKRVILTVFGDILRVPGSDLSLSRARSQGADIRIVYSIDQAVKIAQKSKKEVVHFAIGFETTAPTTAVEILENKHLNNFSIICAHRLIPPALEFLLKRGADSLDGFILPGHVSTIIGLKPYQAIHQPCIISGFEPNDILLSILMILNQLQNKQAQVEIEYKRSVRRQGNSLAQRLIKQVFDLCDQAWRGISVIPNSGLKLKKQFAKFDAEKKFGLHIKKFQEIKPGCQCGLIMQGKALPRDCSLFQTTCTPQTPQGACMVSLEGPCNLAFSYAQAG